MAFPKHHGITLAANSWIENCHVERLTSDPATPNAGKIWFNTTSKTVKITVLDGGGAVVVRTIGTVEDIATALSTANSYTDTAISNLIGGAPALLNTLNELASAIANDPNFSATILADIAAAKAELIGTATVAFDTMGEIKSYLTTSVGAINSTTGAYVPNGAGHYISGSTSINGSIVDLDSQVYTNTNAIGTLASLTTTDKTSLVAAANEIRALVVTNNTNIRTDVNNLRFTFGSLSANTSHVVTHNLNTDYIVTTVWVEDPSNPGVWNEDIVSIQRNTANQFTITLSVACNVKVCVFSMTSI